MRVSPCQSWPVWGIQAGRRPLVNSIAPTKMFNDSVVEAWLLSAADRRSHSTRVSRETVGGELARYRDALRAAQPQHAARRHQWWIDCAEVRRAHGWLLDVDRQCDAKWLRQLCEDDEEFEALLPRLRRPLGVLTPGLFPSWILSHLPIPDYEGVPRTDVRCDEAQLQPWVGRVVRFVQTLPDLRLPRGNEPGLITRLASETTDDQLKVAVDRCNEMHRSFTRECPWRWCDRRAHMRTRCVSVPSLPERVRDAMFRLGRAGAAASPPGAGPRSETEDEAARRGCGAVVYTHGLPMETVDSLLLPIVVELLVGQVGGLEVCRLIVGYDSRPHSWLSEAPTLLQVHRLLRFVRYDACAELRRLSNHCLTGGCSCPFRQSMACSACTRSAHLRRVSQLSKWQCRALHAAAQTPAVAVRALPAEVCGLYCMREAPEIWLAFVGARAARLWSGGEPEDLSLVAWAQLQWPAFIEPHWNDFAAYVRRHAQRADERGVHEAIGVILWASRHLDWTRLWTGWNEWMPFRRSLALFRLDSLLPHNLKTLQTHAAPVAWPIVLAGAGVGGLARAKVLWPPDADQMESVVCYLDERPTADDDRVVRDWLNSLPREMVARPATQLFRRLIDSDQRATRLDTECKIRLFYRHFAHFIQV